MSFTYDVANCERLGLVVGGIDVRMMELFRKLRIGGLRSQREWVW